MLGGYNREQPYESLLNKEDHGGYIHKITVINEDNLLNVHKENWGKIGVFRNYSFCPHVYFHAKKNLFKRITLKKVTFSIAGAGFEPYDLRVMSPTSYQTALPRDIPLINRRCRTPGSNRYDTYVSRDFKSRASANSATPAHSPALGASLCCSYIISWGNRFVNTFLKKI